MPRYIGYEFTGTANSTVVTSALNGGVTDRKYNSGVWSINGTDESSVYGRRIEGNWLTTTREDPAVMTFAVATYTGTGASLDVSGLDFQPAAIAIKNRDSVGEWAWFFDGALGTGVYQSYSRDAGSGGVEQVTDAQSVTAFNADGFTVGTSSQVNASGDDYVAYCWRADSSSAETIDGASTTWYYDSESKFGYCNHDRAAGSASFAFTLTIPSASRGDDTPMVFLGVTERNGWNPFAFHPGYTGGGSTIPNQPSAFSATGAYFGNASGTFVAPTTSTIDIGRGIEVGTDGVSAGRDNLIVIHFAEQSGQCEHGTFTTDGSGNATVNLGVTPVMFMAKDRDNSGQWLVWDQARGINAGNDNLLGFDTAAVENVATDLIDLSGQTVTINLGGAKASRTYIYSAWSGAV